MNQELQKQLVKKYPSIFKDLLKRPKKVRVILPIYFGCDVGDGWYSLLDTLFYQLVQIEKNYGVITRAAQIKEKFGGLRFYHSGDLNKKMMRAHKRHGKWRYTRYYNGEWKLKKPERDFNIREIWGRIEGLVDMAESMSYCICEECGQPGKPNDGGWIVTLCEDCREARRKASEKEHKKYLRREAKRKAKQAKFVAKLDALSPEKKEKKIEAAKRKLCEISHRRRAAGQWQSADFHLECKYRDILKVLAPGYLEVWDEENRKLDKAILDAAEAKKVK